MLIARVKLLTDIVVRPMLTESPPHSVDQKVESHMSLPCAATGSPHPAIHWYRNAELVNNTNRFNSLFMCATDDRFLCMYLYMDTTCIISSGNNS